MGLFSLGKVRSAAIQHLSGGALPIAIDFGVSSLKVLQMEAGEPPSLIAAACLETPPQVIDDPAKRFTFQFQALPKLIKGAGFKGKRAVCAIPAAQMFCKHMQFPKTDLDLATLVESAVPMALNCSKDALIFRHIVVEGASPAGTSGSAASQSGSTGGAGNNGGGSGGAKTEVICLAAARDLVARMLQSVRESRLESVGIHPECFAAVRAFAHINRRDSDATLATMYLDLAAGTTKVCIAHGHDLVFCKTVPFGGRDLDTALARMLDTNEADARLKRLAAPALTRFLPASGLGPRTSLASAGGLAMLAASMAKEGAILEPEKDETAVAVDDRRTGGAAPGLAPIAPPVPPPAAAPEFDLGEQLEILTDDIAHCLRYYESIFPGRKVGRAVFVGGEARHHAFCQHVARRMRMPAQVADPLARMARSGKEPCRNIDLSAAQPGWAIPFGLSLCSTDL